MKVEGITREGTRKRGRKYEFGNRIVEDSVCPETFREKELTDTRLCGTLDCRGQDGNREVVLPQKLQKR